MRANIAYLCEKLIPKVIEVAGRRQAIEASVHKLTL